MSIDTSRAAIRKSWEGLIEYCTQSGPFHDDECPGDSTCDCGRKWMNDGANAACHLLRALADERDQLRADLQAERTAREQAEARVRELEAERDALRDGKPTPGWGKRVPNLNVTGASGS